MMEYKDWDGNDCSLSQMLRKEPEWAMNRIRHCEEIEGKIHKIKHWCKAYPLDVFPEPDMKEVGDVLKKNGLSLGAVSASNMRHVLKGIIKIIEE